jgi:hypothetical protein
MTDRKPVPMPEPLRRRTKLPCAWCEEANGVRRYVLEGRRCRCAKDALAISAWLLRAAAWIEDGGETSMKQIAYIGDVVYARWTGVDIQLFTDREVGEAAVAAGDRHGERHFIHLSDHEIDALVAFRERVRKEARR